MSAKPNTIPKKSKNTVRGVEYFDEEDKKDAELMYGERSKKCCKLRCNRKIDKKLVIQYRLVNTSITFQQC